MKKARPYLPLLRRKKHVRRVLQRQKHHRKRGGERVWPITCGRRSPLFFRIVAPHTLGLLHFAHRSAVISFCRRMRTSVLREGRDLVLDFSATRKIHPEGMLLIVAELDRVVRMTNGQRTLRCRLPNEADGEQAQIVRQVMFQVGVLDLTGYDKSRFRPEDFHSSVRDWRYATGTRVDEEPGDILETHEGRIAPALMQKMQIGLAEAITNSLHHAYRMPRGDECPHYQERRWWMFTREFEEHLTVVVCDLGIGIPASLPLTWGKSTIGKLMKSFGMSDPDLASIKMALVIGETSTGEQHRGKGLPQIWNATRASSAGGITIQSGKGVLGYNCTGIGETADQYRTSIMGTMISWQVPIEAAA